MPTSSEQLFADQRCRFGYAGVRAEQLSKVSGGDLWARQAHLVLDAGHDDALAAGVAAERLVKQQHALRQLAVPAQAAPQRDSVGGQGLDGDNAVARRGDGQREGAQVGADVEEDRRRLAGGCGGGCSSVQHREHCCREASLPLAGILYAAAEHVAIPASSVRQLGFSSVIKLGCLYVPEQAAAGSAGDPYA